MPTTWEHIKEFNWWRWLTIIFLGMAVRLTIDVVFGLQYRNYLVTWNIFEYLKAVVLAFVILEGIRWINRRLDEHWSWENQTFLRFTIQFLTNLALVLLVMNGTRLFVVMVIQKDGLLIASDELIVSLVAFGFTLLVIIIEVGIFFLQKWRFSLGELEKFRKESVEFQFGMLRAQVNPHFLFNSLNTLSGLIFTNQENASIFVRQLARVYRNVIKNREKDVITVQEELETLDDYLNLMKLRFGKNLSIQVKVDNAYKQRFIAPMILQMLIENAVKHNVITEKRPLKVEVFAIDQEKGEFLIVRNNLQLKSTPRTSSGIGLKNIISRYTYIEDREVTVESTGKRFTVKVPILKKEYESPDN